MADVTILGAKEVQQVFEQLEPKLQRRALRNTFRPMAKIAAGEVRRNVPVRAGVLKKSVKVRSIKRSRTRSGVNVIAGAKGRGPGFYGVMVEKGTKERRHKNGKSVGRVTATYFMQRSYEARESEMLEVGLRTLKETVEQLAREGARK